MTKLKTYNSVVEIIQKASFTRNSDSQDKENAQANKCQEIHDDSARNEYQRNTIVSFLLYCSPKVILQTDMITLKPVMNLYLKDNADNKVY